MTNTHILAGLVAKDPQDFELLNQPFAAGTWGIGIAHGDTAFCKFIDDQLTKAAGDGVYEKAWADTVGKAWPDLPPAAAARTLRLSHPSVARSAPPSRSGAPTAS